MVFLDCGNVDRNPAAEVLLQGSGRRTVNIDHHHDNTNFADINHVDPSASCTAEIVWDLLHGLDIGLTPSIAEALYVGVITDTGCFMYENVGPAGPPDGGRGGDSRRAWKSMRCTSGFMRASRLAGWRCSPVGCRTSSATTTGG